MYSFTLWKTHLKPPGNQARHGTIDNDILNWSLNNLLRLRFPTPPYRAPYEQNGNILPKETKDNRKPMRYWKTGRAQSKDTSFTESGNKRCQGARLVLPVNPSRCAQTLLVPCEDVRYPLDSERWVVLLGCGLNTNRWIKQVSRTYLQGLFSTVRECFLKRRDLISEAHSFSRGSSFRRRHLCLHRPAHCDSLSLV